MIYAVTNSSLAASLRDLKPAMYAIVNQGAVRIQMINKRLKDKYIRFLQNLKVGNWVVG